MQQADETTSPVPAQPLARGIADRIRHLPLELGIAAALAVVGAIVAGVAGGASGAVGFFAGVVLVAASYTASTLAIAWADSVNPQLVFPVGITMYIVKFSLLGALLIFLGGTDWTGKIPMAAGIVAAVLSWTTTQIWWTVKTAHPFVTS